MSFISTQLIAWHRHHGRHQLPWQNTNNPYLIWVSEIMLQQTQVVTVIDYYLKFIKRYPNIESLATSDIDEVNEYWSGLGYYTRARNLHAASKVVLDAYKGNFPKEYEKILALPGIGRTTAGAICAFAFGQKYPILDGNVKRVFTRFFGIKEWSGKPAVEKELWKIAEENLPKSKIEIYTQALMDLGATLCLRSKPRCDECPIKKSCKSYINNWTNFIPAAKPKKSIPVKNGNILIIQHGDNVLLVKRHLNKIWGGLYSLPELENENDVNKWLLNMLNVDKYQHIKFGIFYAYFSHYKYAMNYLHISIDNFHMKAIENFKWLNRTQINGAGIPAPIKKLLIAL